MTYSDNLPNISSLTSTSDDDPFHLFRIYISTNRHKYQVPVNETKQSQLVIKGGKVVTNESHAAPLTKETDVSGLKMMDMPDMPDMPAMPSGNFRYSNSPKN